MRARIWGPLGRLLVLAAATAVALLALTGVAAASLSVTPTRAFPIGDFRSGGGYAPGFDGTFWSVTGGGTVSHVDDEGHDLGGGFSVSVELALGIAYYGGRVYIPNSSSYSRIASFDTSGGDRLDADQATRERMGSNQAILRSYTNGLGTLALGQTAKVATLDLSKNFTNAPWYPQAFYGNGVNDPIFYAESHGFETCALDGEGIVIGEPNKYCGKYGYTDTGDGKHPGFNYAIDTAPGLGGLYVADAGANHITHINTVANPGAIIDLVFGQGPGSAAGQLSGPVSVVVQPGTNDVFVSEEGNSRISVFSAGGSYIASFGYGVRDGKDEMQVCGVEIGTCQAGVNYLADPRSLFGRLDFNSESELLAYMPLKGEIQVFSLNFAGGPPSGPQASDKDVVRLSAKPLTVKKGRKTTLTAVVNRGKQCAHRKVLFQRRNDRSWDNLGSALKPGKGCKVSKRAKITTKSIFRAVLINSRNQATLDYSPRVTVKLKRGRPRSR